jgi:hypothetical protein
LLLLNPNPLHEIEDGGQVREHDPVLLGHDLAFGLLDLGLGIGIHEPCLGLDEIGLLPSLFNLKILSDSTMHSSTVLSLALFFGFACFFPAVVVAVMAAESITSVGFPTG